MADICNDNRFEIIAEAKKALLEKTNIETSEDEMKVIDTFLFRCWQMGWLKKIISQKDKDINSAALTFLEEQQIVPNLYADMIIRAVKFGAQWQKQRDNIPQELVEAYWNAVNTGVKGTCDIINAVNGFNKSETSSDLGEYINELSKQFPEVSFAKLSRIAVMVSKWQKEQDQETIELAEDHAMLAGMEKMKEQMLKNAITAEVRVVEDFMGTMTLRCFCDKYKQGDKVKIVILKAE